MKSFIPDVKSHYPPKQIIDLKKLLEVEIEAAELDELTTGVVNPDRVEKIIEMRLRLDALYAAWSKGRIS